MTTRLILTWSRRQDEHGSRDVASPDGVQDYIVRRSGSTWTVEYPDGGPLGVHRTMREARAAAQLHADHAHGDLVEAAAQLEAPSTSLQWIPARSFGRNIWTAAPLHVQHPRGNWVITDVLGHPMFHDKYVTPDGRQQARYAVKGPAIVELHSTSPVYEHLEHAMKHAQDVTDDVLNGRRGPAVIAEERSSTQAEPTPAPTPAAEPEPDTRALDKEAAVDSLARLVQRIRSIEDRLPDAVANARAAGARWEDIGGALGITLQAAHRRYASKTAP